MGAGESMEVQLARQDEKLEHLIREGQDASRERRAYHAAMQKSIAEMDLRLRNVEKAVDRASYSWKAVMKFSAISAAIAGGLYKLAAAFGLTVIFSR